jgi:hypothetical protein
MFFGGFVSGFSDCLEKMLVHWTMVDVISWWSNTFGIGSSNKMTAFGSTYNSLSVLGDLSKTAKEKRGF